MYSKNDIIILLNKKKNILLVLGALLFVILGFLFLLVPEFKKSYHPLFLQITGYSSIVFFGMCLILGIKKLFDKSPGLIINADGIRGSFGTKILNNYLNFFFSLGVAE